RSVADVQPDQGLSDAEIVRRPAGRVRPPRDGERGSRGARVIAGVTATDVYSPGSIEEASAILRDLAEKKQTVTIAGGQTALELGNAPASIDAIVSTMRLDRIVDYAAADQIVTVEAGIPLKHLQERLLPNRQRLALDQPLPARATVGGIVATDAYGPRRTRYGTVRDLIVGMTIV